MKVSEKRHLFHYLAMFGCFSTGLIYAGVGITAILSFFRLKQGGADEGSLLVYLEKYIAGQVLIWIILLGMLAYITWRVYEAIKDPYRYGTKFHGLLRRIIIAFSSLADALIALSAFQALSGQSTANVQGIPESERRQASRMLEESWGNEALIALGIVILATALIQIGYVVGRTYMERLHMERLARWKQRSIHILGWAGHFARGIILGIIGFFLVSAAWSENARKVVNTDKAFDFIGDHIGHFWFLAVAAGTIAYGVFMVFMGYYYDSDKD